MNLQYRVLLQHPADQHQYIMVVQKGLDEFFLVNTMDPQKLTIQDLTDVQRELANFVKVVADSLEREFSRTVNEIGKWEK